MKSTDKPTALKLSAEDLAKLEALAKSLDITWGDRGNISAMLRAIASGKLVVLHQSEFDTLFQKREQLRGIEREKLKSEIISAIDGL